MVKCTIFAIHPTDAHYRDRAELIGRAGEFTEDEDRTPLNTVPGYKRGNFVFSDKSHSRYFAAVVLKPIETNEKESKMEVTVNGVILKGDVGQVYDLLVKLGIKVPAVREKRFHWSMNKGHDVAIDEMDTHYIRNTLTKLLREAGRYFGLEQGIDLWNVLARFAPDGTPDEWIQELSNEQFILFMKLFVGDPELEEEFGWLIEELEYRQENGL